GLPRGREARIRAAEERQRLLALVGTVLRGGEPRRVRGIDQGAPYSPTALNALLHDWLDVPLTATLSAPPWFRYADNLVYATKGVPEGRHVLARIRHLLRPLGLALKGEDGVIDLAAGGEAQILGFTTRWQGERLVHGLGKQALDQLRRHLGSSHDAAD